MVPAKVRRGIVRNFIRRVRAPKKAMERLKNIERIRRNREAFRRLTPQSRVSVVSASGKKISGRFRGADKETESIYIEQRSGEVKAVSLRNAKKIKQKE